MRFHELRDADGTVLARGLHPAIAVIAASGPARAAVISGAAGAGGCRVVGAADLEGEMRRASLAAVESHEASVRQRREKVAEGEKALQEAADLAANAVHESSVASADMAGFDELATRLGGAEEAYESAVTADAEAARAFAAALGELDRILAQRHSASTSLEQARKSRDNRGVPEAVLQQAMNLQAALAKAEAEKRESAQEAESASHMARAASRDALLALEAAHTAMRAGMSLISSGAPNWGPGVPLPALVANYRDRLAAALASAQAAEAHAKGLETAARSRVEQDQKDLGAELSEGPAAVDPVTTVSAWATGEGFGPDHVVLVDDAFRRFGAHIVGHLVTLLAGRGCQVIYLTDDAEVLGWAIGLPHEVGGASTISQAGLRRPALVGD